MNIICGINPVLEALSSGMRHFDRLLVAKGLRNRRVTEAMRLASHHGVPLRFETRETLDRMAGDVPHQGLVAVVSAKPVMGLEALLGQARKPELLVVLDGVEDPRNLGAILRTVEGAGADGVLLPDRHTAGLSETVARASAGGLEHVKVARIGNVVQALEALKARGVWVIGYDAGGSERWDAVDYTGPVALVFGGEGRGMRRLVREKCDHVTSLPLFGHVGSLNVSVVAGIALYEAVRQRRAVPSHVRPIPAAALPVAAHARHAGEGGAFAAQEDDPGEPEERLALVHVEEHDATAWSHPVVLNNVGPRRRGRMRDDDRRLHPRKKHGAPHAAAAAAPEHKGGPHREGPHGGKRRRRRPRHGGQGPGHPRPAGPAAQPGDPAGGHVNAAPPRPGAETGPQPPGGPKGPGGKGRRHRRRKRRPAGPPAG
jgi:23S rRNA (guanosine2251-2'-O)-methyltransferase